MDLSVLEAPARVASVRVDGATRTRATFLASIINPQLAKERPETLEGALLATRDIGHYLREADIFSIVNARLEPTTGRDGDVDIVFTTKEKGRYFLKTSTEVGNNEGTAVSVESRCNTAKCSLHRYRVQLGTYEMSSVAQSTSRPPSLRVRRHGGRSTACSRRR